MIDREVRRVTLRLLCSIRERCCCDRALTDRATGPELVKDHSKISDQWRRIVWRTGSFFQVRPQYRTILKIKKDQCLD